MVTYLLPAVPGCESDDDEEATHGGNVDAHEDDPDHHASALAAARPRHGHPPAHARLTSTAGARYTWRVSVAG